MSVVSQLRDVLVRISRIGNSEDIGLQFCAERLLSNGVCSSQDMVDRIRSLVCLMNQVLQVSRNPQSTSNIWTTSVRLLDSETRIHLAMLLKFGCPSSIKPEWTDLLTKLMLTMNLIEKIDVKCRSDTWQYTITV